MGRCKTAYDLVLMSFGIAMMKIIRILTEQAKNTYLYKVSILAQTQGSNEA